MQHSLSGFKKFLEDMDPSQSGNGDSKNAKQDYFAVLGDEFGIKWDTIAKILGEPWVATHFDLGNLLHKSSAWKIVPDSITPHGADIVLMTPVSGDRTYLKGNRLNKSDYKDKKRYHLNRQELIKFLTQGWTPSAQGAGMMPGGL